MEQRLLVYMTAGSMDEARRVAHALVADQLVACVNILPGMTAVFRWDDAVQEEGEIVLLAKTRKGLFDAVEQRVREVHSYEVPCVVALSLECGSEPFMRWIGEETGSP